MLCNVMILNRLKVQIKNPTYSRWSNVRNLRLLMGIVV